MGLRINDPSRTTTTTPANDDYLLMDGATNGTRRLLVSAKESVSNKETSALDTSTTKYPCNNVVKGAVDLKVDKTTTVNSKALSSNVTVGSYTIPTMPILSYSPTNNQTQYFGGMYTAVSATPSYRKIHIVKEGIITSIKGTLLGSNGTSENVSLYIRVNNTTDYLISNSLNFSSAASGLDISNLLLNIPVVVGDWLVMKIVFPTMVTLPSGLYGNFYINVDL